MASVVICAESSDARNDEQALAILGCILRCSAIREFVVRVFQIWAVTTAFLLVRPFNDARSIVKSSEHRY